MLTGWNDIDRMFGAMDLLRKRLGNEFSYFGRPYSYETGWEIAGMPKTNLYDSGENLELMAEVPGLNKDDLNIKIQGNYLEISGTAKSDVPEGYIAHRRERGTTEFTRSLTLPSDVDGEKVKATLINGILTLVLPKSEAAKPRQIKIN